MYDFWYDYVKAKHSEKANCVSSKILIQTLYCFKYCFIVYIKTDDL